MRYAKLFITALTFVLVLDALWIGGVAADFYRQELGSILADTVYWPAALLFYVFFVIALLVFVIVPALTAKSFKKALLLGALFGFATYMTYDLTSLATIRDWTLTVTIVDILWGTIATSVVSIATHLVAVRVYKM